MEPTQTYTFEGRDGYKVHGYAWLPKREGPWKGIVQVAHGMAEHALRYGRFAKALNAVGLGVYAHDHRGHGKTAQIPEDLGFFAEQDGWSLVVHDMYVLNQKIHSEHPDTPVFLLGHSMGSFLSQSYIAKHASTLSGVILSASVDHAGLLRSIGAIVARIEARRIGKRGASSLLNSMSFGDYNKAFKPNRTEFDWLSRDPDEVDAYVADPLCGFIVSSQLWIDLLDALGVIAQKTTRAQVPNALPILLLTGSKDPVTRNGKAVIGLEKAYRTAGVQDVTRKEYPEGRHEMLNETNRDEVTHDIIEWIKQRLPSTSQS